MSTWNKIQDILDNLGKIAAYRLRSLNASEESDDGYEAVWRTPEVDILELLGGIFNKHINGSTVSRHSLYHRKHLSETSSQLGGRWSVDVGIVVVHRRGRLRGLDGRGG